MTPQEKRIRIETGARIHFGLLDTVPPFGGLGAMIDQPSTVVELSAADTFTINGIFADRALSITKRFCQFTGHISLPAIAIEVLSHPSQHCGFGSGTQLSLAIAEGLRQFTGAEISDEALAVQIADRGKRSAVGVHGFFGGGMIFEDGSDAKPALNPIVKRIALPESWRLLTIQPASDSPSVFGIHEADQFARLPPAPRSHRQQLRERITTQIMPAAEAGDFDGFARAIEDYNHASGLLFAKSQGGAYNGSRVASQIASLKAHGAVGVGQSSWGPGVFAWCETIASAESMASKLANPTIELQITKVRQKGRSVRWLETESESD